MDAKSQHRRRPSLTGVVTSGQIIAATPVSTGNKANVKKTIADKKRLNQHLVLAIGVVLLFLGCVLFLSHRAEQISRKVKSSEEDGSKIESVEMSKILAAQKPSFELWGNLTNATVYTKKQAESGLLLQDKKSVRIYIPDMLYQEALRLGREFPLQLDLLWGEKLANSMEIVIQDNRTSYVQVPMDHYFRSTELFALPNWKSDFVARHKICVQIALSNCEDCRAYPRCENAVSSNVQRQLVTLVTSIATLNDLLNLPEWIKHHSAIGVEQFVVYNMLRFSMDELRMPFTTDASVIFVEWAEERYFSGSEWKVDFITRFDKHIEWFSVLSVDEFLVLGDSQKTISSCLEFGKENHKRNIGQLAFQIIVHGPHKRQSRPLENSCFENYPKHSQEAVYDLATYSPAVTSKSVVLNNLDLISNKEKCSFEICTDPKLTFASLSVPAGKMSIHRFMRSFEEWQEKTVGSSEIAPNEYFASTRIFEAI